MADNVKKYITWIVTISIGIYLLIAWVTEKYFPDKTISDCISYTITAVTIISIIYVQWLWRINPLEKTPRLKKKYKGILISTFDKSERLLEISIKQTLIGIRVFVLTHESSSRSLTSNIYEDHGQMFLTYGFINIPKAAVRDKSEIHYGMCMLNIDNPKVLTGQYFTDRNTTGDMELKAVEK